jgi:tetratricopeptide (TPR) repeat protein
MSTETLVKTPGRRYILHNPLGKGGMGVVYRATDRLTGREVALKQVLTDIEVLGLNNTSTSMTDFRMALAREFKLSSSLRHPNIIQVLDYGFDTNQHPYFTMELLRSPKTILEASLQQPLAGKVNLLVQTLYALAYLHRRGIVHRDLKPANILVANDTVKVLDFGLSVAHGRQNQPQEDIVDTTAGTLAYMAPEILMGETSGIAADLYAVGMMAYEMIANHHPFDLDNPALLINDIMFTMPDVSALDISDHLAMIVARLLQKDPLERYSDASQVAAALRAAVNLPENIELSEIRESFLQAASLVGRDDELKQLADALEKALQGQGGTWLIAGENGVGKTRLVDELRRLAMVKGATVMRGQAVNVGSRPYESWLPILRWLALLTDTFTLDDLQLLKQFIPDIHTLLPDIAPDIEPTSLPPAKVRARLLELLERILRSQQTPVVMILEDLQWAGSETLKLLADFHKRVTDLPLLVVATFRDDEKPDLASSLPGIPVMKLRRLSENAIADLSAAMLGDAGRSPQVVELLRRETEGNVFFVVEVVRALAAEVGQLEQIGRMTLPQRVFAGGMNAVLQRRLGLINTDDQALLRMAAVMGRELDLPLLQTLAANINFELWLTRCSSAALLEVENDQWRFAHDKLREKLLEDTPEVERRELHRRVVQTLENYYTLSGNLLTHVAALAYHSGKAGDIAKEEYYITLSSEQALRNGAYQEALDFLTRAQTLLDRLTLTPSEKLERQITLQQRIAEAHLGMGNYVTAQAIYQAVLASSQTTGNKPASAAAYRALGDVALVQETFGEARQLYEYSLAVYRELQDESGIARALNGLGNVAYELGDTTEARQLYQESLSLARSLGEDWGMAGAGASRITQEFPAVNPAKRAEYQLTRQRFEQELGEYTVQDNKPRMAATLYQMGITSQDVGELDDAIQHFRKSMAIWQNLDNSIEIARCYERLGSVALTQQHYDEAWRYFRQSLQTSVGGEVTATTLYALMGIARLMITRHQPQQALELLAFLLHYPKSPEDLQDLAESFIFRLENELPPDVVENAWDTGKTSDLGTIVAQLLV